MKPSELTLEIEACIDAGLVSYVEGPPGVGKSDLYHQTVARMGRSLFDVRAALYEPTILQGMPVPYNHKTGLPIMGHPAYDDTPDIRTKFASFDFWPKDPHAVILFDEFPSATPAQQAMYYQVFLGHRLGEIVFPDTQAFCLAGNRMIDRAYVNKMSTANKSRIVNLAFTVDFEDWYTWGVNNGLDARVLMFHKLRHYQYLHRFDPTRDENAFPCPRTWEMVSKYLRAMEKVFNGRPHPSLFETIQGMVGEAAAADFCGFLMILHKIINPDLVFLKPDTVDIPDDPMVLYALSAAVANRVKQDNMDKVCTFANRLPREFSALLMHIAIKRDPKLTETAAFTLWAQTHPEIQGS